MARARARARKQGTREGDRFIWICRLTAGEGTGRFITGVPSPLFLGSPSALAFPFHLQGTVVTRRLLSSQDAIPPVEHCRIVLVTEQGKQKIQAWTLEIV
jgi:hypothetical protein